MNYKKIFKSRSLRMKILKLFDWLPDSLMLKLQYKIKLKRKLKLKNPKRFTEKLQWYKLNYRNEVLHTCVDKYDVREYVKSCGLEDILVNCYGVYENVEDIDFSDLPNSFVIKSTDGSGGNNVVLVKNKRDLNIESCKQTLNDMCLVSKQKQAGREWAYEGLKHRFLIEELLVDKTQEDGFVNDYKILCFNGEPEIVIVDTDRYILHKRNFYNTKWGNLNVESDCPKCDAEIPKPKNLEKMLGIAKTLSSSFPFVRVDLYNIDGAIYFGELTFYPWSGYVQFAPDEFDYILGEKFDLRK